MHSFNIVIPKNLPSIDTLNQMFDRYTFLGELDYSSTCPVYWAYDKKRSTHVTIRSLPRAVIEEPSTREKYDRLLKQAASLKHKHIVRLIDCMHTDDRMYVVQEHVNDKTVDVVMGGNRLSAKRAAQVGEQICEALEYSHKKGLPHGCLSPNDIFMDNHNYIKISTPGVSTYLKDHISNEELMKCKSGLCPTVDNCTDNQQDIFSIGTMMCYMATGYMPKYLPKDSWEPYGVDENMAFVIRRAIFMDGYEPYTSLTELKRDVHSLVDLYTDQEKPKNENVLTRLLKLKTSQPWKNNVDQTKSNGTSVTGGPPAPRSVPSGNLSLTQSHDTAPFADRYALEQTLHDDLSDGAYQALDLHLDRKVNLQTFRSNSNDLRWTDRFIETINMFNRIGHPEVPVILDAGIVPNGAYIATNIESTPTLRTFLVTHKNYGALDICEFAKQIIDCLYATSKQGFFHYTISVDNIYASKHPQTGIIYRLRNVGFGTFMPIIHGPAKGLRAIMSPETVAPELYELQPHDIQTTQFMLGNVIYRILIGDHPCAKMSVDDAYQTHKEYQPFSISQYREDLPIELRSWIATLLSPNPGDRFETLTEMRETLYYCMQKAAV